MTIIQQACALLVALILLKAFDIWITKQIMAIGGTESNPLVRKYGFGVDFFVVAALGAVMFVVTVFIHGAVGINGFFFLLGLQAGVDISNVSIHLQQKEYNKKVGG